MKSYKKLTGQNCQGLDNGKKKMPRGLHTLFLASTLFLCLGACVEQPMSVHWTLFNSKKSWSEAQMTCEMMGGCLAGPHTEHKLAAFTYFLNQSLWKDAAVSGVFIGLSSHTTPLSPWCWAHNCSVPVNSSSFLEASPQNGNCVSLSLGKPHAVPCDRDNEYVCETQKGPCTYEALPFTMDLSAVSHSLPAITSETECKASCDEKGIDCWAFTLSSVLRTCLTYTLPSPFSFDDNNNGNNTLDVPARTLYVKRCYTASLNTAKLTWMRYRAVTPSSPCSPDQSGQVYFLITKPASGRDARQFCQNMSYQLAGVHVTEDRLTIADIVSQIKPQFNPSQPVWVDFTAISPQTAAWGTWPNTSQNCGLLNLDSGQLLVEKCTDQFPFLCVTSKPCSYVVKKETCGAPLASNVTTGITEEQCLKLCTQRRSQGENCTACSYAASTTSYPGECWLYSLSTAEVYKTLSTNGSCTFYWWSCIHVIVPADEFAKELAAGEVTTTTTVGTSARYTTTADHTTRSYYNTTADSSTVADPTTSADRSTPSEYSATTHNATPEYSTKDGYTTTTSSQKHRETTAGLSRAPDTTQTPPQSDATAKEKLFRCSCVPASKPALSNESMAAILKDLELQKNATVRALLRYTSARDDRRSSQSLGGLAIAFIAAILTAIILSDCAHAFHKFMDGRR